MGGRYWNGGVRMLAIFAWTLAGIAIFVITTVLHVLVSPDYDGVRSHKFSLPLLLLTILLVPHLLFYFSVMRWVTVALDCVFIGLIVIFRVKILLWKS